MALQLGDHGGSRCGEEFVDLPEVAVVIHCNEKILVVVCELVNGNLFPWTTWGVVAS